MYNYLRKKEESSGCMNNNRPIGVFDSGIGGVTVLEELIKKFPNENFIYVGDTLNLPYGTKTPEKLKELVSSVANYLVNRDVKAIVIACNTATANSAHLNDELSIPVIGVIEPTANYAYEMSKNKNILVLATNVTIESNAYQNALIGIDANGHYYFSKCSEFVDAIEKNNINTEESFKLVSDKLNEYKDKDIDTIILGCTHFGLYSKEIKNVFPNATLIPCSIPTADKLFNVLNENSSLNLQKNIGEIEIFATSDPDFMEEKISWFSGNFDYVKLLKL